MGPAVTVVTEPIMVRANGERREPSPSVEEAAKKETMEEQALSAFVQRFDCHKGETDPKKMFLPALLAAARAPDVEQLARTIDADVRLPLDATSSLKDKTTVCKAVADRLESPWASKKFDKGRRAEREEHPLETCILLHVDNETAS